MPPRALRLAVPDPSGRGLPWITPAPAVRVFLVDDHEVVRRGVAEVLEDDPGITVAGEAGSVAEALARVPAVRPDVVVVDMRLPDGDGADLCRALRAARPGPALPGADQLLRAGGAATPPSAPGPSGFLLKQVRGPALVSAVRTVASGGTLFEDVGPAAPRARAPGAAGGDRLGLLTDQERTVLRLIGEGLTNRQIGDRMGLAEKTVKNYTSHLLAKLGLERRTQAAILATELRDRPAADRVRLSAAAAPTSGPRCPTGRREALSRPPRRSARSARLASPLRTVTDGSPQPSSVTTHAAPRRSTVTVTVTRSARGVPDDVGDQLAHHRDEVGDEVARAGRRPRRATRRSRAQRRGPR